MALVSVSPETASYPVDAGRHSSKQPKDYQRHELFKVGCRFRIG